MILLIDVKGDDNGAVAVDIGNILIAHTAECPFLNFFLPAKLGFDYM